MNKENILSKLPNKPGIYLWKDKRENILYVGKAKDLKKRVSQYFNKNSIWKQDMMNKADRVDFLEVKNESEALYLEDNLIKTHQPEFNSILKGFNSYAYIKITNDEFPQIYITRFKKKDGSIYIGPKHNTKELKIFLQYLRQIYQRRGCKKTQFREGKFCSDYHFGLCKGWCSYDVSPELIDKQAGNQIQEKNKHSRGLLVSQSKSGLVIREKEYAKIIKSVKKFFEGNINEVKRHIKILLTNMVEQEYFEGATKLRDIYYHIEQFAENQIVSIQKKFSGYTCLAKEMGEWIVYSIMKFQQGKLVDVINNKQPKDDIDMSSLLSSLEVELGTFPIANVQATTKRLFAIQRSKLNKKEKKELEVLGERFIESYVISSSLKSENILNGLLASLQKKYKLKHFPYQIECIDISHLGGERTSGALACFVGGVPNKKLYRKYKITGIHDRDKRVKDKSIQNKSDDYESLREVILRRFKHQDQRPTTFVIDGGKGQLGVMKKVIEENPRFHDMIENLDIFALGKGSARDRSNIGKNKNNERIAEIIYYFDAKMNIKSKKLDYDEADRILLKVRNEAHRFANVYRKKQMESQWK